ncbi:hypothetical protein EGW08_002273 [Elysia chlorotica]|uniref:Uncharacterized protein n=1 Tax=Elysia chlorotica TaxID=188477 RepID=A0A3S1BRW0_ELYCH|nr:hypothetical protein EGW08_002273 [Elysia chlorotica]
MGRAPTISIAPQFAAVIFMLTGRRSRWSSPILDRSFRPAKQDWHPVLAIAEKRIDGVALETVGVKPTPLFAAVIFIASNVRTDIGVTMTSQRAPLLWMMLTVEMVHGTFIDLLVIPKAQAFVTGEEACRSLGYDGLAVLKHPETYRLALELSLALRTTSYSGRSGLYVGLRRDSVTGVLTWDDGSECASDLPWAVDTNLYPTTPYGVMSLTGHLTLSYGKAAHYAICGKYSQFPTEALGTSVFGQQPSEVSSRLAEIKTPSYLECVFLCGQDFRCRAAQFNLDLLTCVILGPGSYKGLEANAKSQTFIRNDYPL